MVDTLKFYLPEDSKSSLEKALNLTNISIQPPNDKLSDYNALAKVIIRNWIISNSQALEMYRMTKAVDNQPVNLNIVIKPELINLIEEGTGILIEFPIGETFKESLGELFSFINALNAIKGGYQFKNLLDLVKSIITENIAGIVVKDLRAKLMSE